MPAPSFVSPGCDKKQSSLQTIFSCWNTCVGSSIVCLPWAFYHSGLVLGILICIISAIVSLRTCILIIRVSENHADFYDTMKAYWGMPGYYVSTLGTMAICQAACTAFFIIMTQMLYLNVLAILYWIFGTELPLVAGFDLT